jgi:hypothetical protein
MWDEAINNLVKDIMLWAVVAMCFFIAVGWTSNWFYRHFIKPFFRK